MSFPNRTTTYDEAINDLKRKLQQQEYNLTTSSSQSLNHNYTSGSLRQSSSTISEIGVEPSQISPEAPTKFPSIANKLAAEINTKQPEKPSLPNGDIQQPPSQQTVTFKISPVKIKNEIKESVKMPILSTFQDNLNSNSRENDTEDETESESQDESSQIYRNVVNDVRKSAGNSQSDADVLKLMLKERDELLKDYAIKLNESEMESRSSAKKTRALELEKQRMEKQLKEFQKILDEETKKRENLEGKLSDMQYTMKDLGK